MWLRDQLPHDFPTIRVLIYGYDTKLLKSESFQTIDDLALSFIEQLKSIGKSRTFTKPLLVFAHSLGGLMVKRALCLLAGSGQSEAFMLGLVRLVVLFGVPSAGMKTDYLLTMVDGQPNQYLVECLSQNDPHGFLRGLNEAFNGISLLRKIRLISAYETQRTPTAKETSPGVWNRVGDPVILVPRESAVQKGGDDVFPIDRDHSSMVKFIVDDTAYAALKRFLQEVLVMAQQTESTDIRPARDPAVTVSIPPKHEGGRHTASQDGLKSLWFPEIQDREEQIANAHEESYEWLSRPEVGLFEWLESTSRLFWIRGKPGSGKSPTQVRRPKYLWFFFHARGSLMQKSFEGLLRSILYQLGSICPTIGQVIDEHRLAKHPSIRDVWTDDELLGFFDHIKRKANIGRPVVLFLDALDEFNGYPEAIADFLGDLNTTSDDLSALDIRICFSSRPWDAFVERFDTCHGFRLQDWTSADISRYTNARLGGILQSELPMRRSTSSRDLKEEMMDYIRSHAEGVFLWVTMVLNDLERLPHRSAESLYEQLTKLPIALEEYYRHIIHRISPKDRLEAFILLELVLRDLYKYANLKNLFFASRCARGHTLDACQQLWRSAALEMPDEGRMDVRLNDLCGGMLEVVESGEELIIQFMHQTARDFVDRPEFAQLILPRDSPSLQRVDGHVMWTKHLFTYHSLNMSSRYKGSRSWVWMLCRHAYPAEQRTGKHLATFLDSVPDSLFSDQPSKEFRWEQYWINSRLSFAVLAGLELYLVNRLSIAATEGPQGVSKLLNTDTGLSLAHRICGQVAKQHWSSRLPSLVAMMKLLVDNGLDLNKQICGWLPMQVLFRNIGVYDHDWERDAEASEFDDVLGILLSAGCDPDTRVDNDVELELPTTAIPEKVWHRTSSCRPLHLCTANLRLTLTLVRHGANVNAFDGEGFTPLDRCVKIGVECGGHGELLPSNVLQVTATLIEAGARMSPRGNNLLQNRPDSEKGLRRLLGATYTEDEILGWQDNLTQFWELVRTAQVLPKQPSRNELSALYPESNTGHGSGIL